MSVPLPKDAMLREPPTPKGPELSYGEKGRTDGSRNRSDRADGDSTEATAGDGDRRCRANLLTVLPDSAKRNRVRTRLAIRVREGKRLCRGDVLALRCGRLSTVEIFIAPTYRECRVRVHNTADRHTPRAGHAGLERRRAGDRSDTGRSERTEGIHRKRERIARLALPVGDRYLVRTERDLLVAVTREGRRYGECYRVAAVV